MWAPLRAAGWADVSRVFRSCHRYHWWQLQPNFQLTKKRSVNLQPSKLKKILLLFLWQMSCPTLQCQIIEILFHSLSWAVLSEQSQLYPLLNTRSKQQPNDTHQVVGSSQRSNALAWGWSDFSTLLPYYRKIPHIRNQTLISNQRRQEKASIQK